MRLVRATLLFSLVAVAGCHRWVPHDGAPVPQGTDIRVRVTDAGSDALRRSHGLNSGAIAGPVAYWNADGVGILARTSLQRPGFPATVITDTISVPSSYVSGVDVKTLDNRRTAAFTAGMVLGAVGLVLATRAFGGEREDRDPTLPPPEESWIIRIPFGFGFGGR